MQGAPLVLCISKDQSLSVPAGFAHQISTSLSSLKHAYHLSAIHRPKHLESKHVVLHHLTIPICRWSCGEKWKAYCSPPHCFAQAFPHSGPPWQSNRFPLTWIKLGSAAARSSVLRRPAEACQQFPALIFPECSTSCASRLK